MSISPIKEITIFIIIQNLQRTDDAFLYHLNTIRKVMSEITADSLYHSF